jgi:hypothetical protein
MGTVPDCEEGKRHQKRGDVLFRAFPANAEDLPMGHILSLVLTAMLHSFLPMPDSFPESRAGLGVLAQAGGIPCFIEDLVVLSRDRRPATSTLRNMQLDATEGVGSGEAVGDRSSGRPHSGRCSGCPYSPRQPSRLGPPGRSSPAAAHLRCRAARRVELLTGRLVS